MGTGIKKDRPFYKIVLNLSVMYLKLFLHTVIVLKKYPVSFSTQNFLISPKTAFLKD